MKKETPFPHVQLFKTHLVLFYWLVISIDIENRLICHVVDSFNIEIDLFTPIFSHFRHRVATAVYQVTRPGHEHCDATEGILLDITPLVVDGKKLVTLYDKDLTEGVNLLIGMYIVYIDIFD